jgi:hypothetical protein
MQCSRRGSFVRKKRACPVVMARLYERRGSAVRPCESLYGGSHGKYALQASVVGQKLLAGIIRTRHGGGREVRIDPEQGLYCRGLSLFTLIRQLRIFPSRLNYGLHFPIQRQQLSRGASVATVLQRWKEIWCPHLPHLWAPCHQISLVIPQRTIGVEDLPLLNRTAPLDLCALHRLFRPRWCVWT